MLVDWVRTLDSLGVGMPEVSNKGYPCAFCGGTDRFSMNTNKPHLPWNCRGCCEEGGDGFEYVARWNSVDRITAFKEVMQLPFNAMPDTTRYAASNLSEQAKWDKNKQQLIDHTALLKPIQGSPAEIYLKNRGITGIPDSFMLDTKSGPTPFGMFWLDNYDGHHITENHGIHGAMVTKMLEPKYSRVSQYHYTILDKLGKKMEGYKNKLYSGKTHELDKDSFRLAPLVKGETNDYIIAEGIETALSCWMMYKELDPAMKPYVFAATNANMMARFVPWWNVSPESHFYIMGDNDENHAGQNAAFRCKVNISSLRNEYHRTQVYLPPHVDEDFNDLLLSPTSNTDCLMRPV